MMGRPKVEIKKKSISIAIDPDLLDYIRENHINLSSLINKLLKEYVENGRKQMPL